MGHCDKDAMGIIVGLFSKDNVQVRLSDLLSNRVVSGLFHWEERA